MKAIILAAGKGSRMGNLTLNKPKHLLKFQDTTLLERQIQIYNQLGITETIVVTGYLNEQIKKVYPNIVVNEDFENTHSTFSLRKGLNVIQEPDDIIIADGDQAFEPYVIKELKKALTKHPIVLICKNADTIEEKGTRVLIENEQIIEVDRNLRTVWPWAIYSGVMGISKKSFQFAKDEIQKEIYKPLEIGPYLNTLCERTKIFPLILDPPKKFKSQERLDIKTGKSQHEIEILEQEHIVIKKSKKFSDNSTLIPEIKWLLKFKNKTRLPKVLDYDIHSEIAWYKMPYYKNYKNFQDIILKESIPEENVNKIIKKIIQFNFENIYNQNVTSTPPDYTEINHILRVKKRLKETISNNQSLWAIISYPQIIINNQVCLNWPIILDMLSKSRKFRSYLQPPHLNLIHGDLQLKNILIMPDEKEFLIIDPKSDKESDPLYDIAKLLHSFNEGFELYKEKGCELSHENNNFKFEIKDKNIINSFKKIRLNIIESIPDIWKEKDPHWKIRLEFIEAMHIVALMPWTIDEKYEKESICNYLYSVLNINKFLDKIEPRWKKIDKIGKWININTIEDYENAKEILL